MIVAIDKGAVDDGDGVGNCALYWDSRCCITIGMEMMAMEMEMGMAMISVYELDLQLS